ncbi:MAG TPA: Crp/Fnr family transcriptional regulator [Candidatus Acidoferrum sp.]|nr:Crp/Fnr family transcriptional regulator [Candidatus Acidoferrum sp.]
MVTDAGLPHIGVESPFLEGLRPIELQTVLSAATRKRYAANSVITHQGFPANHLLMLIKGRARLFHETSDGKRLPMMWVTPGHLIGSMTLIPRTSTYLVSTEAIRDSLVLCWERNTIRELAYRFPRIFDNCLAIAASYFTWYIDTHVALTCHTAPERLGLIIRGFSNVIGQKVDGGVELDITNEELANAANITPFTVSRLLSQWQRRGLVRKLRGKILVKAPEKLVRLAGERRAGEAAEKLGKKLA